MPEILQLPPDVVNKIAAGEVIERPSSVVKELLENSIDAGSRRIDIELEQGGAELIRVVDDGCGIDPEQLALALQPHATSKLRTADDLFNVATLGFRGEALASIAGISRFIIQSRPRDHDMGAELRLEADDRRVQRPWAGAAGTRIEVRNLFHNIPVRKKFLKSPAAELGQASEAVTRVALAHAAVHITLRHNGRTVHDLPPCGSTRERIGLLFGPEIRDALHDIEPVPGTHRVSGCVADPACDRGNNRLQYFFVNGRWFRDRSLQFALADAYRNLIMSGRHPVGFLFLEVPTDEVDVNIHPTKAEVKFRAPQVVFSLVRSAVKDRLQRQNFVPKAAMPARPIAPPEMAPLPNLFVQPRAAPPVQMPAAAGPSTPAQPREPAAIEHPIAPPIAAAPAVQMHDAYLIQETPEGMLVIDQHALHERILFEQMRRRLAGGRLDVQRLLVPDPVELPAVQAAAVLEVAAELAELGLEVSDFGGGTVLLSSYPVLLGRRPPREILLGVVDELMSKDRTPSREGLLDHLLATMACKAAVKAGDRLSPEEIQHLLELRDLAEESHHCPHGRPTTLLFSRQDLDRQFRRT